MKYLCLVIIDAELASTMQPEDWALMGKESHAYDQTLVDSGVYVHAEALDAGNMARTVRVRSGQAMITDGPFTESKEAVAGFILIDVADAGAAMEIARNIPMGSAWWSGGPPSHDVLASAGDGSDERWQPTGPNPAVQRINSVVRAWEIIMPLPIPVQPGPGEESVWDYPRPPRLEHVGKPVQIYFVGKLIVDAPECFRVLETSHPPVYYISPDFIEPGALKPAQGTSMCEWKGQANYFDVVSSGKVALRAAWRYVAPFDGFAPMAGFVAFYAGPMDRCTVGGEIVTPQPGNFYGGWITRGIIGPFKGEPGSLGW